VRVQGAYGIEKHGTIDDRPHEKHAKNVDLCFARMLPAGALVLLASRADISYGWGKTAKKLRYSFCLVAYTGGGCICG
jgi:hypothetical protein